MARRILLPWSRCLVVCVAASAVAYDDGKSPPAKPRRSIIGVPEIGSAPHGPRFVVGYDGRCRPLFDDGDNDEFEHYGPERSFPRFPSTLHVAPQPPSTAVARQYSIRELLLAVIENVNEANEKIHRVSRETWRKLQGELLQPIKY